MVDFSVLQGDCDGQTVVSLVREVFESHEPLELVSIMTMVQKVIPFYPSLGPVAQDQLVQIVGRSFTFFSQLVSFVLSMRSDQREVRIFKTVILEVLRRGECFYQYIQELESKLERNSLNSLFFGSKLFNVLLSEINILEYLEILRVQWGKVFKESSFQDAIYGSLFVSMIILHPTLCPDIVFGQLVFISDDHCSGFKKLVKNSTLLDQRRTIRFLLLYLQLHTNLSNYRSVWAALEPLPLHKTVDLDTLLTLRSDILQEIVLRQMPRIQNSSFVLPLIRRFAECSNLDDQVCRIFVIMLRLKMDSSERKAVSKNSSFLDAVTKRLAHEDATVREKTMYVAKLVTDGQLQYDSDFSINIPELDISDISNIPDYTTLRDSEPSLEDTKALSPSTPLTQELARLEISEELEPIVFVKDLVKKFESQENKPLIPLLQSTVKLVRQKKDFPLEVGFYSSALLLHISTLNNDIDEPNFENWRINALVGLLVVTPEKVQDLQRILFNSELSLQQRMSVLTSMSFAARELRGFDNGSTIVAPQYDFPTERLPWDRPSARHQLHEDEYTNSEPVITSSHPVWRSKKLDNAAQVSNKNHFKDHAPIFFYPLAHGWLNGIELGTYDKLFKRHYMKTTAIVYQCCHPHRDYDEMTETMLQLTTQALQQGIEP
ncbi:hypothetical protein ZYGR_0I05370 [Zygosaccharomyces rouxii]|uniref:ZYRO0C12694p n=2 Tax=Zygosaccharomyces rouxii TaxID=4956 RepID=C5DU02_ZYGRC|nr:uncharacterized protein ZYRO0C12694g [Zygosaccharomyces rouxii]KAH9201561.1 telomere length regulation protein-domain-containing protein [Zygosaccharomyces rouxii]GAV48240.1 hypothetical protein ZYGR_0I05370 [Zygosaccharomyces rouxii]CAR27263.1 ZYRO0C12694p [Zygosaccharomyces rouxii]